MTKNIRQTSLISGEWYHGSTYELIKQRVTTYTYQLNEKNNLIHPDIDSKVGERDEYYFSTNSPLRTYKPFDFYYSPVPNEIVNDILNYSSFKDHHLYIHTLFASLDYNDTQQLLRWCNYFGTLSKSANIPNANGPFWDGLMQYPLSQFVLLLKDYQLVTNLFHKMKYETSQDLQKFLSNLILNNLQEDWICEGVKGLQYDILTFSNEKDVQKQIDEKPYYIANELIASNLYNEDVFPFITFPHRDTHWRVFSEPVISFSFQSLISILKYMLTLDFTSNRIPRKCANQLSCNCFFIPSRDDAIYCSDTCKNRAKQQRHRAKLKQKPQA